MERHLYQDSYQLEETHWWHIAKRELILSLIKRYCQKRHPRILDVGCGTGKNVEVFSTIGTAFGIDASDEAIRFCRKRGLTTVSKGVSTRLPYGAHSFDVVTMLDVLEHTEDTKTLKEVQRVLKPDGLFFINVPAFPRLWSTWDEIAHHKRRYTKDSLTIVLRRNGFSVVKLSYLFASLFVPVYIIRRIKSNVYKKNTYPSDFQLSERGNRLLLTLSRLEIRLAVSFGLPLGTSLFCISQKQRSF